MNCKLTRQDLTTHNGFQWPVAQWVEAAGTGGLCTDGMLHYYEHPLLAVLHNPIHGSYHNPRLWRVEVAGRIERDGQMKAGASRMRLAEEVPLPEITTEQRVMYAIYCARAVLAADVCPDWHQWAGGWLTDKDRSAEAAVRAAVRAAMFSASAAADAAAVRAAMFSASAAADAAAVRAAVRAAWAAETTTDHASCASSASLDLIELAKRATE